MTLLIRLRSTASLAVFLDRRMENRGIEEVVGAMTRVKWRVWKDLPSRVRRSLSLRKGSRFMAGSGMLER